jgi:hypothetical protein
MGRAIYGCTKCKKTFGRRYNADRHNLQMHNEMAVVYNKETDQISNKGKVNKSPSSLATNTNNKTDEEKIFKIFEKISPLIDELDVLLSTFDPANRIKMLSDVIISSLISLNPVHSIKGYLSYYRSLIGINKASAFVAASENIPLNQAKEKLKTIILVAPYSKDKYNK